MQNKFSCSGSYLNAGKEAGDDLSMEESRQGQKPLLVNTAQSIWMDDRESMELSKPFFLFLKKAEILLLLTVEEKIRADSINKQDLSPEVIIKNSQGAIICIISSHELQIEGEADRQPNIKQSLVSGYDYLKRGCGFFKVKKKTGFSLAGGSNLMKIVDGDENKIMREGFIRKVNTFFYFQASVWFA